MGPTLFIMNMNDIIKAIEINILFFAADTSLFGADAAETVNNKEILRNLFLD